MALPFGPWRSWIDSSSDTDQSRDSRCNPDDPAAYYVGLRQSRGARKDDIQAFEGFAFGDRGEKNSLLIQRHGKGE